MKSKFVLAGMLFIATLSLSAQEAKYEIKSAIIKKEVVTMGQKFESFWYIDDFGKKESTESKIKMGGTDNIEKHILTILEAESIVNVDLDMKTASRIKMPVKPINFLQLTPEVKDKYKIKELGEDTIAGKHCHKYSFEISRMGQTVQLTTFVWKGLVLKSETSSNGMAVMVETSTEINENVPVAADKFVIPAGITVPQ